MFFEVKYDLPSSIKEKTFATAKNKNPTTIPIMVETLSLPTTLIEDCTESKSNLINDVSLINSERKNIVAKYIDNETMKNFGRELFSLPSFLKKEQSDRINITMPTIMLLTTKNVVSAIGKTLITRMLLNAFNS